MFFLKIIKHNMKYAYEMIRNSRQDFFFLKVTCLGKINIINLKCLQTKTVLPFSCIYDGKCYVIQGRLNWGHLLGWWPCWHYTV